MSTVRPEKELGLTPALLDTCTHGGARRDTICPPGKLGCFLPCLPCRDGVKEPINLLSFLHPEGQAEVGLFLVSLSLGSCYGTVMAAVSQEPRTLVDPAWVSYRVLTNYCKPGGLKETFAQSRCQQVVLPLKPRGGSSLLCQAPDWSYP